ncbi:MAG: transcription termination/antitermination protein NusA [Legionellales bacterium]|nr:transcription termination/antitermination protein NusA [Legionellales bacterium]
MSKDLILIAEALSNEKGVDKKVVIEAIQSALESATRKKHGGDISVRVSLDEDTGDYLTFRCWEIVEDDLFEDPEYQVSLSDAVSKTPESKVGDIVEEPLESVEFGRISAQAAKHVIFQKVREAERKLIVQQYTPRIGEIITGIVKRVTRDFLILDLGGITEAILYRNEMLQQDIFRMGDRVKAVLHAVEEHEKGPQLFVSRTKPRMLVELFKIEVPEIGENIIEIKGAARDAGHRAKISVKTNDGRIDPIGACVGMRGARVQAVSGELGGERIDIILWDENPAQLVINAMAPAEVASIVIDEDTHAMDLAVNEEQLSQAIGKNGQNVRLASELTGWTLNVMSIDEFNNKSESESSGLIDLFKTILDVDDDIAGVLAENGFTTIDEIAYIPEEELLNIEGFDLETVKELRSRANDSLLTSALSDEGGQTNLSPSEELLALQGLEEKIAYKLAENEVISLDDFADLSIDELTELVPELDRDLASELIMRAREHWFVENK